MKKLIGNQQGFTFIELTVVIAVITILIITALPFVGALTQEKAERYAFNGISEIAQASKAHFVDETELWYRTWPADVGTLSARGYLPNFTNANGSGGEYQINADPGGGITVSSTFDDPAAAIAIASQWGPTASFEGGTVTVGVVVPGAESSHETLIDRQGERTVEGTLEFETDANIDFRGDSQLIDVLRVDARVPSGLGVVDSNAINGDEVTADGFRYN